MGSKRYARDRASRAATASGAWRSAFLTALKGLELDQDYLAMRFPGGFRRRSAVRALMTNPALRAPFLMRLSATGPKALSLLARELLLAWFSCDVSPGCSIEGALYIPHPLGIVIGHGVRVAERVSLFQNVTLGAGAQDSYPTICSDAVLFPGCVVAGGVTVGAGAKVGANTFVNRDVPAGSTVRAPRAQLPT